MFYYKKQKQNIPMSHKYGRQKWERWHLPNSVGTVLLKWKRRDCNNAIKLLFLHKSENIKLTILFLMLWNQNENSVSRMQNALQPKLSPVYKIWQTTDTSHKFYWHIQQQKNRQIKTLKEV